jgi:hypothetical protein
LNKSCEREEEKYHLVVNWMTLLHKKTIASHTQELKNDEKKEEITRNYSTIEFHSKLFLKLSPKFVFEIIQG